MIVWLPLFIAIPLGVGFLLPLLEKFFKAPRLSEVIAVLTAIVQIVFCAMLLMAGDVEPYWMGGWSPIGISLVCDGLTKLLLVMTNVVALVAVLYSISYMRRYTARPFYFSLLFLMVAGMNGVVLTGDLFNLFVFLEVAAISSYALVAFGVERDELEAAFKYIILGSLGSTLILFAIGIIYNRTGVLNMGQVAAALRDGGMDQSLLVAACFFFVGFGLKAAMVPFHAWLPDAHPSAPAPISALLSGILIKALGVYALCRVFFTVLPLSSSVAVAMIALGVTSMVVGVFLAVGQWDFKRLLAYHSISQMGYVVLAMGVAGMMLVRVQESPADRTFCLSVAGLALLGGLFHLFNHAMFKSLLFLCSGAVEYATGTRQLKELGGLAQNMPVTGLCCRVAALSISGVPPFNGFFSKLIIVVALIQAQYYTLAAITVGVSFMTLLSFVKVQRYVLHGTPSEKAAGAREVPIGMAVAMIILALVCTGAGILVPFHQRVLLDPAQEVMTASHMAVPPQDFDLRPDYRAESPIIEDSMVGDTEPNADEMALALGASDNGRDTPATEREP